MKKRKEPKSPLAEFIGTRLFQVRSDRDITMERLAKLSGLTCGCICQIENGQSIPSVETLMKVSRALEVDINSWIAGFNEGMTTAN